MPMSFNRKLNLEEPRLITKILVGVDGSENSEKALDYSLEVADKFSASVLVLNVFEPPPDFEYLNMFPQPQASGYPQELIDYPLVINDLRKMHETVLSKATERATKLKPALKIIAQLKEGDVSSQIVETAANGEFDLVVIGHSKNKEVFLGSTCERVAHHAGCAVLIVK